MSYFDKTASAIATSGFAVLCLFYVFLPEFKRFKGFGVEAELLEKKIEEADRLLGQLRQLATPMAEMLFTIVARMGRWDSMVPRKDRNRVMEEIEAQLTSIGVSPGTIDYAKKDWHKFNVIDIARPVFRAAHEKIMDKIRKKENELGAFPQPIPAGSLEYKRLIDDRASLFLERDRLDKWIQVSDFEHIPDYLEQSIKESQALTLEEQNEIFQRFEDHLEDLRYYAKNHRFRRLDHWLSATDS